MISENELRDILTESIIETLAVEPQEVIPTARLFADLGAESIDVLDLSFRLEKRLGIKVQLEKAFTDESLETDSEGRLTPESIAEVQKKFPAMTAEMTEGAVSLDDLKELLTVEAIMLYLKDKLSKTAA